MGTTQIIKISTRLGWAVALLDRQIVTAPPKVAFEKASDQCEMTHIAEATVRLGLTKQSNFEKPPSNSTAHKMSD